MSSFSVLYGISNINSAMGMAELSRVLGIAGFGMANAYALLVFCLLYSPCVAAVGTIRRETKSLKFTMQMVLFQIAACLVFCSTDLSDWKPEFFRKVTDAFPPVSGALDTIFKLPFFAGKKVDLVGKLFLRGYLLTVDGSDHGTECFIRGFRKIRSQKDFVDAGGQKNEICLNAVCEVLQYVLVDR